MDKKQWLELANHWRVLATEAREQGDNTTQPGIFRAHAFGLSDGLEIAANDIMQLLEELGNDINKKDSE